jgi:hypothetical protein
LFAIFIVAIDPVKVSDLILTIAKKYERRLGKVGVATVELVGKTRQTNRQTDRQQM